MRNLNVALTILCFLMLGCNKPNEAPEHDDPIFQDIQRTIDESKKLTDEAIGNVTLARQELNNSKPQTSQTVRGQSKVTAAELKLVRARQAEKYWHVRLESRRIEARESYLKAWYKKEKWPDPKEYVLYKEKTKPRPVDLSWDLKKRLHRAGVKTGHDVKASANKEVRGNAEHGESHDGGHDESAAESDHHSH